MPIPFPIIGDGGDAARSQCFSSAHRCNRLAIASVGDVALAANLQRYVLAMAALTLLQETIKHSGINNPHKQSSKPTPALFNPASMRPLHCA